MSQRKRSSRIAMKEIEKEEARLLARKKAEDEEKNARARRQEARVRKEEEEREVIGWLMLRRRVSNTDGLDGQLSWRLQRRVDELCGWRGCVQLDGVIHVGVRGHRSHEPWFPK